MAMSGSPPRAGTSSSAPQARINKIFVYVAGQPARYHRAVDQDHRSRAARRSASRPLEARGADVRLERAFAAEEGGSPRIAFTNCGCAAKCRLISRERWSGCGNARRRIPDWLPMRYIDWLPPAYEVALGFRGMAKGRSNIYSCFSITRTGWSAYGVYVGMSKYSPAERFDQHKAGIRAVGQCFKTRLGGTHGTHAPSAADPARGCGAYRGRVGRGLELCGTSGQGRTLKELLT